MSRPDDRSPEVVYLREFKKSRQWDLMRKHGAHGLGIGWKSTAGEETDRPALIFYVATKQPGKESGEPIPASYSYLPEDAEEPVELLTDVVEAPAAQFEDEASEEYE